MNKYKIEIATDKKQLSELSSQLIADKIQDILVFKERAHIALCGGSTPFSTYLLLGSKNIPWNRVDIFLGDERFVDRNNSDSNSYMLGKSLSLMGNTHKVLIFILFQLLKTDFQRKVLHRIRLLLKII